MQDKSFVPFTKDMIGDYTILVPDMLPMHFELIIRVLETYGYHLVRLTDSGKHIAETGLKYVHNDTCYPAILTTGQFLSALLSGEYDPHKTALIMFQTGGGCRASNYISLLRKALAKADMAYVPVISFSLSGLEKHPGFRLTLPMVRQMLYAVLYGDLLMTLSNQTRPYENEKGAAARLCAFWTKKLGTELGHGKVGYRHIKENCRAICRDFQKIPKTKRPAVKVGIVGEIFVKYSPLGNNHLEDFLVEEGAETVVPGLWDFCSYCLYNSLVDREVYGKKKFRYPFYRAAFSLLCRIKNEISAIIRETGDFTGYTPFEEVVKKADGLIHQAVKMGEGWLLTAEMMELADSGCANIVCTQPFGCLPNHICGKGMMKPLKELRPDVNIVAVDYDASASEVNQENRLRLMLANAGRKPTEKKIHEGMIESGKTV